jgi:hypothetical protein
MNGAGTNPVRQAKGRQVLSCSLKRKRCACGKQATAKQLQQYKVCDACFKAKAK